MSGERDYRGTVRTLSVLRALNERDGMSVIELSARTDISRAALYRILAVLERNGYITRAEENGSIFLTNLIQTLSAGYQDEARIREAGGKVLDELQKQIKWPTDLGILQNFRIKLLMTTRSHSPLVIDRGFAGIDMPIAYTALGQAYIAFCTPSERKAIIEHLAGDENAVDCEMFRNKARTNGLLKGVRSQGFLE
jgi:IclR family mhp operon transcriptional activator